MRDLLDTKTLTKRERETFMRLFEKATNEDFREILGELGWSDIYEFIAIACALDYGCEEEIFLQVSYPDVTFVHTSNNELQDKRVN